VVGGIRCLQVGTDLRNQLSWNKEGKLFQQRFNSYIIKRLVEQGFVTFAANIFASVQKIQDKEKENKALIYFVMKR
jgi:Na+-translocating ferredoxin:NAD+ oxidoreductase RnfC subunit